MSMEDLEALRHVRLTDGWAVACLQDEETDDI